MTRTLSNDRNEEEKERSATKFSTTVSFRFSCRTNRQHCIAAFISIGGTLRYNRRRKSSDIRTCRTTQFIWENF